MLPGRISFVGNVGSWTGGKAGRLSFVLFAAQRMPTKNKESFNHMVNDGKEAASGRMTEAHPLEPFLPEGARLLMLGSFPPARSRWSMEFYYPNFQNDMWRVMGLVFYGDRERFVAPDGRHFDREAVETFCRERGIALSDTAAEVVRARGNASDRFLEVVRPFDLAGMLERLPACRAVAATGQKAADTLAAVAWCEPPAVGCFSEFEFSGRMVRFYRMPSTSRAYPKPLAEKAAVYGKMFAETGLVP